MFEDNDDLDITKEMEKHDFGNKKEDFNGNRISKNENNLNNKNNNYNDNDNNNNDNKILKDHDITINDNDDVDIVEIIKNVNIDNNNNIKTKKVKQQTLYNYTNLKNENNSPLFNSQSEATTIPTRSIPSTPSKNLKLRKKKSEVLYNETVRQKYKRKQLHGTTCPCCSDFFSAVNNNNDNNRVQEISRHRYNNIPKETPEEYWDVNFPSSKPDNSQ